MCVPRDRGRKALCRTRQRQRLALYPAVLIKAVSSPFWGSTAGRFWKDTRSLPRYFIARLNSSPVRFALPSAHVYSLIRFLSISFGKVTKETALRERGRRVHGSNFVFCGQDVRREANRTSSIPSSTLPYQSIECCAGNFTIDNKVGSLNVQLQHVERRMYFFRY